MEGVVLLSGLEGVEDEGVELEETGVESEGVETMGVEDGEEGEEEPSPPLQAVSVRAPARAMSERNFLFFI